MFQLSFVILAVLTHSSLRLGHRFLRPIDFFVPWIRILPIGIFRAEMTRVNGVQEKQQQSQAGLRHPTIACYNHISSPDAEHLDEVNWVDMPIASGYPNLPNASNETFTVAQLAGKTRSPALPTGGGNTGVVAGGAALPSPTYWASMYPTCILDTIDSSGSVEFIDRPLLLFTTTHRPWRVMMHISHIRPNPPNPRYSIIPNSRPVG